MYSGRSLGPFVALVAGITLLMAVSAFGASNKCYTVRRGESLYSIARAHGLSPTALAELNGLDKNCHLYMGQRLKVPSVPARPSTTKTLPNSVQRAINRAAVRPGLWRHIVIHHSGVDVGTAKSMDRYHREERHMENGLAYHFVIGNGQGMGDGEIVVGSRWAKQLEGGHLAIERLNKTSLGICLVGNFEIHKPTRKQMEMLTALTRALLTRCKLPTSAVTTHRQAHVGHTRCPGKHFPTSSWLQSLKKAGP
jgi:murein DD-endopeptidase MepM/ murein hydrolase activator NlpD